MSGEVMTTERFVLFWNGWPSQWYTAYFVVDGVAYNCAEQFMMAEKARVFRDDAALAAVLKATTPKEQKALGRRVRGFDERVWNDVCRGIVYRGNLAKFGQNDGLRRKLMATEDRTIVEASPSDPIWGIGLAKEDPRSADPARWRGTNWLGVALMQVREALRNGTVEEGVAQDAELERQLANRARW